MIFGLGAPVTLFPHITSPHPQILIHGSLGLFNNISLQNILKRIILGLLSERDYISLLYISIF